MRILFVLSLLMSVVGCASKLVIQSEPPQAEVFAQVEGRQDRVSLGTTPFEVGESELNQKLGISADSVQWVNLSFEKKEFSTREVVLPSSRWGERNKILKLRLSQNADKMTVVQQILSHFFNAKAFTESRQFGLAHSEIDKVLVIDPKSVRAINMKAGIFYLEGKMDEARRSYEEALAIDPKFSDSITMLERIRNRTGGR